MLIEEQILLEENELKPNRYIAAAMLCAMVAVAAVMALNYLEIFHVDKVRMQLCGAIILLCSGIIQVIGRVRRVSASAQTKYFVMFLVLVTTLTITTLIAQWTELMIALPIMLALQYHNRRVTAFAIGGAMVVALCAAPLSVGLGVQQLDFYEFLIRSLGYSIGQVTPDPAYDLRSYLIRTVLYISLPRCVFVAIYGVIAAYITRLVSRNISSRASETFFSHTDVMTGLFNRACYEARTRAYAAALPEQLICVYADADGLRERNNEKGHAEGDRLLKACARQMALAFGEQTYRIGGDEFLAYVEDAALETVQARLEQVLRALEPEGYHMSFGVSCLEEGDTVEALVRRAEHQMYAAKRAFYTQSGRDRRKNR